MAEDDENDGLDLGLEIKVKLGVVDEMVDFELARDFLDGSEGQLLLEITISGPLTSEFSKNKIARFIPFLLNEAKNKHVKVRLIDNSDEARRGHYVSNSRSLDYLTMLLAICNRADILWLEVPSLDTVLCFALCTGLMANHQLAHRGIGGLKLDLEVTSECWLGDEQINLLNAGFANAKRLESLWVSSSSYVEDLLVHCLKGNKTIRDLHVEIGSFDTDEVIRFLGACRSHPTLYTLDINIPFLDSERFSCLNDYICSEDCKLRSLSIKDTPFPTSEFPATTSGKRMAACLGKISIESATISEEALRYFCSIISTSNRVELHLDETLIEDITPLEELLVGNEGDGLRKLTLSNNQIDKERITRFASKLPKMLSLESLDLTGNPFLDCPDTVAFVLEKVKENTSLESFNLGDGFSLPEGLKRSLDINAGGRRGIFRSQSKNLPIPPSLWPLILLKMERKSFSKPSLEEVFHFQTNNVYHLLVNHYMETMQ